MDLYLGSRGSQGLMKVGGIEGDHLTLGYRRQQGRNVGGYLSVGLDDGCSNADEIRSHGFVVFNDISNGRGCFDDDLGCCLGGRLVNVIGCVIAGTASSDGGNECGGLGTDGNKVGDRGNEAF
nr:ribonuclease H-like domain-containing protein [Tanacetum cinerariifolium]